MTQIRERVSFKNRPSTARESLALSRNAARSERSLARAGVTLQAAIVNAGPRLAVVCQLEGFAD